MERPYKLLSAVEFDLELPYLYIHWNYSSIETIMTAFKLFGASFLPSIQSSNLHIMSKASSLQAFSFVTDTSQILLSEELQTASQTFEPQVNVPALSAFLVIAVVFGLLQLRINSVRYVTS